MNNILGGIGLINCVTALLLTWIIYTRKKKLKYYILLNACIAFWSFFYSIWLIVPEFLSPEISFHLVFFGMTSIPICFLLFAYETSKQPFNRSFIKIDILIGAVIIFLEIFTDFFIKELKNIHGVSYWPVANTGFPIYFAFFCMNFSLGQWFLMQQVKHDRRIIYILIATAIGIIGSATNFFMFYEIDIKPMPNILVSVYVLMMAYAIVKHNILDISIALSEGIARLLTMAIYAIGYTAVILLLQLSNFFIGGVDYRFLIVNFLYIILVAETYPWLRSKIQTYPHTMLIQNYYNVQDKFEDIKFRLQKCVNFKEILILIWAFLKIDLSVYKPHYYVIENYDSSEPLGDVLIERHYGDKSDIKNRNLSIKHPLIQEIYKFKDVLTKEDAPRSLKHHFIDWNAQILLPIFSDNTLLVLFVISESEFSTYSSNDISLFRALSNHLGLVLDTMRSHERERIALYRAQKTASMLSLMNQYQHDIKACWAKVVSEIDIQKRTEEKIDYLASLLKGDEVSDNLDSTEDDVDWEDRFSALEDTIHQQHDRATNLSVTMGRILSDKEYKTLQNLDINSVINQTLSNVPLNGINIIKKFDESLPKIEGDLQDMQILLINLIKNSCEAMKDNKNAFAQKTLTIETQKSDTHVNLALKDTAGGLPDHILDAVQNDRAITSKESGSGLGLVTVKRIVTEHGGRFYIKSKANVGTAFYISFPIHN